MARSQGMYTFKCFRNYQTIFQRGFTILHFHQQSMKISISFTSLATFGVVSVFYFSHSDRCVVISTRLQLRISLITSDMEHLCILTLYIWNLPSMYLLSGMKYLLNLLPLFNWVVCFHNFKNSLYIPDASPL